MTKHVLDDVTLEGVTVRAAVNTLIAIEQFAGLMWPDPTDRNQVLQRNELAAIVLPLRAAVDEAAQRIERSRPVTS